MSKHTKQGSGKYMIFRKKKENPKSTYDNLLKIAELRKEINNIYK